MITGQIPNHLIVGARTGFLQAVARPNMAWQRVAQVVNLDAAAVDLVDLGAAPMPTEQIGRSITQEFIEKHIQVKSKPWEIVIGLSHNAVNDSKANDLVRKAQAAGENFQKHMNARVFQVLNGGDGTTYGLAYDGQEFFDSDHVDEGAAYQTAQDNEFALALSLDNFNTVNVAAQKTKDDQGQNTNFIYDLLVVPPDLEYVASNITSNFEAYDTASRERNPFSGKVQYITSPELDSTSWFLTASGESVKPLLLVMREQPNLQSAWFAPREGSEGGIYYFKFYSRYDVVYGDWRLAFQGNT